MIRTPKPICRHPLENTVTVTLSKKIVIISKHTGCCFYCGNAGINSAFFYWIYGSGNQPMRSQNLLTLLQHLQHLPAIIAEKDAWPSWLISGEASFNILTLNISKFHAETRVICILCTTFRSYLSYSKTLHVFAHQG